MSVALSVQETDESPRVCEHMLLPGSDPFVFERALAVGDHGHYRIESVEPELLLVFGGDCCYTVSRAVHLREIESSWSDQVIVDRFGGKSLARLSPGHLPRLLGEYWPTRGFPHRKDRYLACLLECVAYDAYFIVTAARGETGYILRQFPFPSKGRFDPNALFVVPI